MRITAFGDMPCPPAGSGVHSWLMAASNRCRNLGFSPSETFSALSSESSACGREVTDVEINDTIKKAYAEGGFVPSSDPTKPPQERKIVIPRGLRPKDVNFNPDKLAAIANRLPGITEKWFGDRSQIHVDGITPADFLGHLYRPGEIILIFDRFRTKEADDVVTLSEDGWDSSCLKRWERGHKHGVWYLANPVDGKEHEMENGGMSCRNWKAVTSFRYAVLESDAADTQQWLAALSQFPIPIAAIYSSAGKSVHALWQLNAKSKEEWDQAVFRHKPMLKIIGADPGCLSAVRLSRLPQCERVEKSAIQKLIYLSPKPTPGPLADLPPIRSL